MRKHIADNFNPFYLVIYLFMYFGGGECRCLLLLLLHHGETLAKHGVWIAAFFLASLHFQPPSEHSLNLTPTKAFKPRGQTDNGGQCQGFKTSPRPHPAPPPTNNNIVEVSTPRPVELTAPFVKIREVKRDVRWCSRRTCRCRG